MRAKFIYEVFTENDSDPISDMGIGVIAKLKEVLENKYRLKWLQPEAKDIMRIKSIISKAKGDPGKERMYARNMANAITNNVKAYRRYLAAKEIGGEDWDVTIIFFQKVLEMYGLNNPYI
jgi:hypothetical protein